MLIRISCRDQPRGRESTIEGKELNRPSMQNSKAGYTDRKPEVRILCGSVEL